MTQYQRTIMTQYQRTIMTQYQGTIMAQCQRTIVTQYQRTMMTQYKVMEKGTNYLAKLHMYNRATTFTAFRPQPTTLIMYINITIIIYSLTVEHS